jgi:hypothetical protein
MSQPEPNPLEPLDAAAQQRISERAYHLWEADGRPHGQDREYWERAELLERMEEHPHAGELPYPTEKDDGPVIEEASIQENLGEFPDRFSDQGERAQTPRGRKRRPPEQMIS